MGAFLRHSAMLFLALRAGDLVNLAAGLWFVPRFVSPGDIGAVLPLTSFATFAALPVFAFAMTMMRESAVLSARGERGRLKSLLTGVFAAVALGTVVVLAATAWLVPRFAAKMGVGSASVGFLAMAAALLGCTAPVYTDALQALKRFRALAAVEVLGSACRVAVMMAVMPFRALAGYFAGQAALPAFRMAASAAALRGDLAVAAEPFWTREAVRRISRAFLAVLAYQAAPMFAALVEQSVPRVSCPAAESAGYYMASRFSDFLHYLTWPMLLVMFPYTAQAAERGESTAPYVKKCALAALAAATALALLYAPFGERLISLLPNGGDYRVFAGCMPMLVATTVLTTCQVFYTNAEVSAGRYGFLLWFVPLHLLYPLCLYLASRFGMVSGLDGLLMWFAAASVLRFAASVLHSFWACCRAGRKYGILMPIARMRRR